MSRPATPERFCARCERRCGAAIDACAAAGAGCAYAPIAPPTVCAAPPAARPLPGILQLLLLLVLIFVIIPAFLVFVFWLSTFGVWLSVLPVAGLVALAGWWLRRRKRTLHALGDAQGGAFLAVTTWPHARRPAIYLWHAPAEPVALAVPPLLVPEGVGHVAPSALLHDPQRPERATDAEAVQIGLLLLLDLIARGELLVQQRQVFSARGPAELSAWTTSYELVRPAQPTGAIRSALDARLLGPFALVPFDAPLSADALIGGLYEHKVPNPAAHLAERAGRPPRHASAETLQLMRSTLNQRLDTVAAQHPQLLAAWRTEIGRALAAHQEASEGGGGGDGGGG